MGRFYRKLSELKKSSAQKMYKKNLAESVRSEDMELSADFIKIITAKKNPAVEMAKRNGVAYTVARGLDIVEVRGDKSLTIGRIDKSDIVLSKGTTYKIGKVE